MNIGNVSVSPYTGHSIVCLNV